MLKVGFVGWRGLVGSVLLERMRECGDFEGIEAAFFSTSDVGGVAPVTPRANPTTSPATRPTLEDAFDVDALARYDVIITCQGTDYTRKVHPKLREEGWSGYWIDAASAPAHGARDGIAVGSNQRRRYSARAGGKTSRLLWRKLHR